MECWTQCKKQTQFSDDNDLMTQIKFPLSSVVFQTTFSLYEYFILIVVQ
jgi:hypothetical protein